MPNEERQIKIADVISLLQENRHISGDPSFAAIESLAEDLAARPQPVLGVVVKELPHTTVNDLLKPRAPGRRRRRPRQDFVESLWATLAVYGIAHGKNKNAMHSLAELRARMAAIDAASTPSGADLARAHGLADATSAKAAAEELLNGTHGCCSLASPRAGDAGGAVRAEVDADQVRTVQRCAKLRDTRLRSPRVWWYGFRDVVPPWFEVYLTLEPELESIRTYAPRRVPGLLQTPAYAKHAIAGLGALSPVEIARRVELRLARQQILHRSDPPVLWHVIEERALLPGGFPDDVRRDQIRHLLDLARLPHVCIQLMPSGGDGASDGPLTLLRLPEQGFPDLIFLEQANHGLYPHGPGDERYYAGLFNSLATQASTPDASVHRLHDLLGRLQPEDH
ncbi:DUF5753 domain-containing protein [Actinomadura rayongensis]|uniref:DUF5753 domain-containing protein n=1 Tax=Actinomadura rayongensis TaxID=1429076 RepID=A0A6I4VXZ4_9ACTN|nr:DUF5753 domain-containing protein [Actinomadura rayongensis]MXQ62817.1 hypothetical protein [Actinomadura rayongensis]